MTDEQIDTLFARIRGYEFDASKSGLKGESLAQEQAARTARFRLEVGVLTGLYNHPREANFWAAVGTYTTRRDQALAFFAAGILAMTMANDDPTFPFKMMDF